MFVHIGLLHLLFNLWVLANIGPLMERLVGPVGFLILYLFAGLAGSAASLAWRSDAISAGASGAIFGLFGGLLGFMLRSHHSVPTVVVRDLRSSGLAFFGYNLLYGLTNPQIDQAAHLGGAAAGFLGGLVLSRRVSATDLGGRGVRNAVLAGSAAVVVVLAVVLLPPTGTGPHQVMLAMEELPAIDKATIDAYARAVQGLDKGQRTPVQAADAIARDVLPPWRAFRARVDGIKDPPASAAKRWPMILEYLRTKQEYFEATEKALRDNDAQATATARQKGQRLEQLLQTLNKGESK
jgi:rhomboid protease GluP